MSGKPRKTSKKQRTAEQRRGTAGVESTKKIKANNVAREKRHAAKQQVKKCKRMIRDIKVKWPDNVTKLEKWQEKLKRAEDDYDIVFAENPPAKPAKRKNLNVA